jgi:hypothetical protein
MEPAAYYNTNKIEGEALASARQRNLSQEDKVLALFMRYPDRDFSPHAVQSYVMPNAPLTSTRRAITNLTNKRLSGKKHHGQAYHGALWNAGAHMET